MYKLTFFTPASHKEEIKDALFDLGVGRYANYDRCSFETLGVGQFRALSGADPYIGSIGVVERVEEYKVEMICDDATIKEAIITLKRVHPYEEVAYEVFRVEEF